MNGLRILGLGLVLVLAATGCGGDSEAPPEIQYEVLGTWTGTTATGVWVEMHISAEATGCCSRVASGQGRLAPAAGDTLAFNTLGFNQTGHVFFNLFGGEPETLLGQFSGGFESSASLAGVMLGPEAFGQPAVGPFTVDSLPLVLHRQ